MAWVYLIIAGIFEWGWPIGLKLAWKDNELQITPTIVAIVTMAFSGFFLFLAQKTIPMGTAYAVWTGIGALGAFVIGIYWFGDSSNFLRIFSAFLIIAGVVGLMLSSGH
jgi:quaternary ammonium compound-resistance protein SugE